jgi:hypothetical protein
MNTVGKCSHGRVDVNRAKKEDFWKFLIILFWFQNKGFFTSGLSMSSKCGSFWIRMHNLPSARCLLFSKSLNNITLFRIIRCLEADASKPPAERTFPVFVVVATKFRQLAGTRPVLELCLSSEGTIAYNPPSVESRIRVRGIHMFLGLPDPDPFVRDTDPDPTVLSSWSKNSKKNLDSCCFVISLWLLSLKYDVTAPSKVTNKTTWRSLTKKAGSGSIIQRYGPADPDPYQKFHNSA